MSSKLEKEAKGVIGSMRFSENPDYARFLNNLSRKADARKGVEVSGLDLWPLSPTDSAFWNHEVSRRSREAALALEELKLIRQEPGSSHIKVTRLGIWVAGLLRASRAQNRGAGKLSRYVGEFFDLNLRYEELEEELHAEFLKRHAAELSKGQRAAIREMNIEHLSFVAEVDRHHEEAVARLGLGDVRRLAALFFNKEKLLVEHDLFLYREVRSILSPKLRPVYEREVGWWVNPKPDRQHLYLTEFVELNKKFGLDALTTCIADAEGERLGETFIDKKGK